ncbi:ABC transporter permease [Dyella nitratireducens]|uniref:ABC transporter ATP-binding protein n=1 Tax=Dyella nitratireducens TaxID=1849580 RepID=A0ABQ1FMI0_9GAMM|nr:ABC transporter permease [Dyella nitratireducens]GGA19735.1 ABC transporter ATP-binding protein [Dyella nitratireducens]GLQ44471.1 ABC transporter ATP-binding protein [Dyella nitratireducens]
MFAYYVELAMRSLRRSPGLTALMILTIGFGVAASMTTYSVFRGLSADPIPWKSDRLFVPQIDAWGPGNRRAGGEPEVAFGYLDAMTLMRQHRAKRQSAIYSISASVMPSSSGRNRSPIPIDGYAVYDEFFPMLDVTFHYGSSWSADDDAHLSPVVVISDKVNKEVFGGGNSVGKMIDIDNREYRIVGVTNDWNPQPNFYYTVDVGYGPDMPDMFMPFPYAVANNIAQAGWDGCRKGEVDPGSDFTALLRSDCVWIGYMVELDDAMAVQQYRGYLDAYASEQQKAGRFHWAPNTRLRDVPAFLDYQHVVPSDTRVSLLVAQGLLIVCLVNTVGLLLAKFLRRSGEVAVRRALGASRTAIYAQFLTEAGVIGVGGGVLGLLFTAVGMLSVGQVLPARLAAMAKIEPDLLSLTLLLAVAATLVAGIYPAYRAARVLPAWQLKAQ